MQLMSIAYSNNEYTAGNPCLSNESKFYKVLSPDMNNRGFQYKLGLNVLEEKFNTNDMECSDGGLYFCNLEDVVIWLSLYTNPLICKVDIPNNANVIKLQRKYKTDCIILSNPVGLFEFMEMHNLEDDVIKYYKNDKTWLTYVRDQTIDMCMMAVLKNGLLLEYVHNQLSTICLSAVRQNGNALQFVKNQTEEICKIAIKNTSSALQFVKNQTEEICLIAVTKNGNSLEYVQVQTEQICLCAVRNKGIALKYVIAQTPDICLEAIKENYCALGYVKDLTYDIYEIAMRKNIHVFEIIENKTVELCMLVLKMNPSYIKNIVNPTAEMLKYVNNNTEQNIEI
jgi:hypothetical protein